MEEKVLVKEFDSGRIRKYLPATLDRSLQMEMRGLEGTTCKAAAVVDLKTSEARLLS